MTGPRPAARRPGRASLPILLGFALLALGLGIDFHLDVRARDAFSWMDPYQYYDFALGVLAGHEHLADFEVASVFPLLVVPFLGVSASIASALWTQFAALLLLFWSVHALCRELSIRTASPGVAALVASSPLLIGLSRTLYVELTLSALVSLAFVLWLRLLRNPGWRAGLPFAGVVAAGLLTKMTFPLFLLVPVTAAVWERVVTRRDREAFVLASASLTPIVLVVLVQAVFLPRAFGYILSLGNTAIPPMRLIGPTERGSLASLTFYLVELGRTMLLALTPFLALAAWQSLRTLARTRRPTASSPRAVLWLWLLGPLVLLVLQPVKEPRHVAPCVVPAVLLAVLAIEAVPGRAWRRALLASAFALAALNFFAVTRHVLETPYFLDRGIHLDALARATTRASDAADYAGTPPALRALHWKYDHGFALVGFPANEALALTWWAFPGVTYDLETFDDPQGFSVAVPGGRFEDPWLLAAFDTYNRRCGWHGYVHDLPRDEVVANADFVLWNADTPAPEPGRFPGHRLVETIERSPGWIHVLRRIGDGSSLRVRSAKRYLERHPQLSPEERAVVARELRMAAGLGGVHPGVGDRSPELARPGSDGRPPRNIYWVAGYDALELLSAERIRSAAGSRSLRRPATR